MRVAMYYSNDDVRTLEIPVPRIGPGELLIRVRASGICGSDVMEWYRLSKAPQVLGHEVAGEVVQVGDGVNSFDEGDRVVVTHHVPCNTCHYCLSDRHTVCDTLHRTNFDPGGFSELLRVPAINAERGVFKFSGGLSYAEASFTEPLGCVLRGQRRAKLRTGQSVLVIGSGLAGLLHINLARTTGAGLIVATDLVKYRLKAAKSLGADFVLTAEEDIPARLREANYGRLADLVIVCTGAPKGLKQALQSVECGGTVLFFAPTEPRVTMPVAMNDVFFRNDITLTTTYAAAPADLASSLNLIVAGSVRVDEMITHRLGLAETGLGFKLTAAAGESLKVIVEPQR